MSRTSYFAIAGAMVVIAVAIRLNNAMLFPVLGGYDAFAHFGYIWFLSETWHIPLADAGWQFFQPPLYYALMAGIWEAFPGVDPVVRLRIGIALISLAGLLPAGVVFAIVRRYFPENRLACLLAPGLMLFLPVHLYSSAFLGNEALNAAVCALAIGVLLWALRDLSFQRAAVLGAVLGLAMLVKFTAFVVVAAAFATIVLRGLVRRDLKSAVSASFVAAAVMLVVCGWHYARNVAEYGTPFQMSREELFLQHAENAQPQGRRTFLEYVLFDPLILYRPQWPRGMSVSSGRPPGVEPSALKESIPTGLYANTWFDGFGGFFLPPVTHSEKSRRAGQLLLTLALVPTGLMAIGFFSAFGRLRRKGWDDTLVAMILVTAAMIAVLVHGTRSVPTHAAIKATYLTPISVAFAFFFALGLERLRKSKPSLTGAAAAGCAALGFVSAVAFSHEFFIENRWLEEIHDSPQARNLYGVVYYAADRRDRAKELFESSANANWHLGQENLAAIALEEGRNTEAAYRLRYAANLQLRQMFGTPADRARYAAQSQAEYMNSLATVYWELGWPRAARRAVETAFARMPSIPEIHFNRGVLKLSEALAIGVSSSAWRDALVKQAAFDFEAAVDLDPAFYEAHAMSGVALTLLGDCEQGAATIRESLAPDTALHRIYPVETGPGDVHAAGLHRRRKIERLPEALDPQAVLKKCSANDV